MAQLLKYPLQTVKLKIMEAIQKQYNTLKELAISLMKTGNLKEYFQTITQVNDLQIQLLEYNLKSR